MWLEVTDVLDRVMLFLLTMSEAASLLEMEDSVAYKASCQTAFYQGDEPI